jgi:hypothetical protein
MGDMTTTFDNKVKILARINRTVDNMPQLGTLGNQLKISLGLATLLDYSIVTEKSEKIVGVIDNSFAVILSHYGLEDTGFDRAWQIDPNIPMPTPPMKDEDSDDEDD